MEKYYYKYPNATEEFRTHMMRYDAEYNMAVDYYNLISDRNLLLTDKEILTFVRRYAKTVYSEENQHMIFSDMKTFKDDQTNEFNKNLVTDFQVSPEIIRMINFEDF